ncbi:LexA family protein [Lacticaseibacillus baoqingensis]|uniref:LexA family protein n=1 Tax=Lacticaseibacillus baoqingensis TaxID=2486013 RepID=A0ABW4E6U4_9LACO|nr:LexA family transcriptional regulator [Lacticaseibacillus baoqingensis]
MTIGKRIAELRKKRSWTQAMLSDKMSVSQSTVTMWENGKRAVSSEDTIKLAALFGVTTDFLLGLDDLPPNAVPVTATETVQIPVYGEIQAGVVTLAEQNVIGQLDVKKDVVERYGYDNLFALKVRGESMNRKIINGHTAVFCKGIQPESGDIVAVMIDHEDATVKRYKETSIAVMFEPESWDDSFKPYIFPKIGEQDFKILGKYIYDTSENI